MKIEIAETSSPVGRLTLAVHDTRLVGLCFEGLWPRRRNALERRDGACTFVRSADPAGVASRLASYFDGDLGALAGIDVETWGTPFQQSVWRQLRLIPAGQTRTYAEIARAVGAPTAVRAVGAANGANPVGIVVPCHRVIGSDGRLTGFAGGLPAKRWLLEHESGQRTIAGTTSRAA
jgi:methylated-DNA-[protein]-cysteine S-methyltransferase